MLKTFQARYPRIEFELLPSNFNNEISDWVLHGQADCGFISLPTPAEKYLDCWLLQRDQWKVIVPCNHPLAGRDPFPPEALEKYPVILLDEGDDYEIQEVFDTLNIRPNIQYTVQQDQTILAMVSSGLGISIIEELMLQRCVYPLASAAYRTPKRQEQAPVSPTKTRQGINANGQKSKHAFDHNTYI